MNSQNKTLKAHADYALMMLEEKLEPLIKANKYKREPEHLTMAKNIIFDNGNHYEIKGDK